MSFSDTIGATGVALLLIAFFMNLFKLLKQGSKIYLLLNFIGAGLACYASYLINFIPFVVLEGAWTAVSVIGLARSFKK